MCTGIRINADNGDVVFARTMEFDTPLPITVGYFPRGQKFTGDTPTGADGMQWENRFAFGGNVLVDGGQTLGSDGMNEKGLVAGIFNLPGVTEFTDVTADNRDHAVAPWQITLFVLGKYATTDEAAAGLLAGDVVVVDAEFSYTPTTKGQLPIHLRVGDPSGKTIIVEWHTAGKLPTIVESPMGICTNTPRFEFHLDNWKHFENLSPYNPGGRITTGGSQDYKLTMGNGYVGMPGGSAPADRFIRASLYSRDSYQGATGADAVWTAWHVMNNFDLPMGIQRNVTEADVESSEYTVWSSVSDTKNLKYYFRTYENHTIFELDLNAQDPEGDKILSDDRPATLRTITEPTQFALAQH